MNKWVSNSLQARLITAAILIPAVVAGIFYLPPAWFFGMATLVFLVAAWEWTALMGDLPWWQRVVIVLLLLVVMLFALSCNPYNVLQLALAGWLLILLGIIVYPKYSASWYRPWWLVLMAIMVLVPYQIAVVILRARFDPVLLLYVLFLVWVMDSGAYFFGKRYGEARLAPIVSPQKTYAGLWGGLACSVVFAATCYYSMWQLPVTLLGWLLLSLIVAVSSVMGDLAISMLKRKRGVKDTGDILPGHGGLLDRIDSLTAAAPCFALIMLLVMK